MNHRKVTKATKRRLFTLGILSAVIIFYFVFSVVAYTFDLLSLRNKEIALKIELDELRTAEDDLKIELQKLKDPEYIARYARENYLYSKDGEYIIKIAKDDDEVVEAKTTTKNYYIYYLEGGALILVITTILVIKKKKKD